ncbi:MAG: NAD(P)-dependent glycerol-3-phosphate dehydrogenase [Nitrospinae bacterium]|nr:NAD(P)-dependent glycerol-3-phosphate dehydrogenase [Nitrospinota bacterium]
MDSAKKAAVIGAGAWGTALAWAMAANGASVKLWTRKPEAVALINSERENRLYLPGAHLPENLAATSDETAAVSGCDIVIVAIPTQFMRKALAGFAGLIPEDAIIVSASKGVENETLALPVDIISQTLGEKIAGNVCCLSGPSFARELVNKLPTAATLASKNETAARTAQKFISSGFFRLYVHRDVTGVELGGALKNVIAIAAGISDGLGFGHNTRAALITRGLMEIRRLGVAMGAEAETFSGLSGMGDLVLTCTGDLSRNRTVGVRLGQGETLSAIQASMTAVAEGVATSLSAFRLAEKHNVDTPIVTEVFKVLYENKSPKQAVADLMGRELKSEFY